LGEKTPQGTLKRGAGTLANRLSSARVFQQVAAFLSLILLVLFFSFASPHFFSVRNLVTIGLQTAVIGIMAMGVTYVIITAGIDLSIGSLLAVTGVVTALAIGAGAPIAIGVIAGAMSGLGIGLFNGFVVAFGKVPPFVVTLGMMMTGRGLALVLTDGRPLYFREVPEFRLLAQTRVFDTVPLPVVYLFVVAIIAGFILKRSAIGRYIYAVGSNEEAARLSGVNVTKIKLFVYSFSGFMTGLAGVILAARLNSAQPAAGQTYELDAIAAAVIGGTSLMGGEGTITGTMVGAFIMSVLRNGLNLMGVSQFWQQVIMGLVVIGAVFIDTLRKQREAKAT